MARLSREFYSGNTVETAQNLLGKVLVRQWKGRFLAGRITETEAYIGRCDKACHAYHYRRTARTETLFLAPGHAYIYLIYGMYHCLNFVTEPEGRAGGGPGALCGACRGDGVDAQLRYGEKRLRPIV